MVLKTAPHAFEDLQTVQANGGGTNWPWRNAGAARTLLEGFEPLSIPFDLASLGVPAGSSKGLPLRPGFEYRFEAFLRITPQVASTYVHVHLYKYVYMYVFSHHPAGGQHPPLWAGSGVWLAVVGCAEESVGSTAGGRRAQQCGTGAVFHFA